MKFNVDAYRVQQTMYSTIGFISKNGIDKVFMSEVKKVEDCLIL